MNMGAHAQSPSLATSALCPQAPVLSLQAQRFILRAWLLVTDALVLGFAFLAAYWVRFDFQMTIAPDVVPAPYLYSMLAAFLRPPAMAAARAG